MCTSIQKPMTPITLTIALKNNDRTCVSLLHLKDYWVDDSSLQIVDGGLEISLKGLDYGRLDSEGDDYLLGFLNVLPGDLIGWYQEEN